MLKHFNIWQWADFVRGLGEEETRSAMASHLSSHCARCQRIVNVLGGVALTARGELVYEPPNTPSGSRTLSTRCNDLTTSLPGCSRGWCMTVSARLCPQACAPEPSLAARAVRSRKLHSIQLEHQPASGLITLLGQLADRTGPERSTSEIPVWLKERKRLVATALCNRFGEFQLEYEPATNLRLHVTLPSAGKRVEVSLDQLNPAPAKSLRSGKATYRQARPRSSRG